MPTHTVTLVIVAPLGIRVPQFDDRIGDRLTVRGIIVTIYFTLPAAFSTQM